MKKYTLTEAQLKKTIKKAVLVNERKRAVNRILVSEIKKLNEARVVADKLLTEGPLSGVFGGLSKGAQAFGQGMKQAFGSAQQGFAKGQVEKQAQQAQQAAQKQVQQALKAVSQAKQKYNQELLKNAEVLNAYHDTVANLFLVFHDAKDSLGPASQQIAQDVQNSVQQLAYDLESERQQITNFMQSLKKETGLNVDLAAGGGQKQAQEKREREADEYGRSAQPRASMRVSRDADRKKAQKSNKK